jgi:hypothetical protein
MEACQRSEYFGGSGLRAVDFNVLSKRVGLTIFAPYIWPLQ